MLGKDENVNANWLFVHLNWLPVSLFQFLIKEVYTLLICMNVTSTKQALFMSEVFHVSLSYEQTH